MAESGFGPQSRGILTALRAAAIVIIVTGLNDVLAGAVPRYEPLYLYLAGIALVVWLDGVLLGVLTAAVAIGFYALLFLPRGSSLLIPSIAAVATVIVIGVIRGFVRARRRDPPEIFTSAPAPLLPPVIQQDNTEVLSAIDDLREELRTTVREPLDTLRADSESARAEAMRLRGVVEAARRELDHRDADITALRAAAEELRRTVDVERGRAEGEHAVRTTAVERVKELERQLSTERIDSRTRIAELEQWLADAHGTVKGLRAQVAQLEEAVGDAASLRIRISELEEALASAHATHDARVAEWTTAMTSVRAASELRSAETATLRTRITELEEALQRAATTSDTRVAELTREREGEAGALRTRITALEEALTRAIATSDTRIAELNEALASARATSEERESEAAALRARIAELDDARTTSVEREADAAARIAELEAALASARATSEERDVETATRIAKLDAALASARATSEERETDAASRIAELEAALASVRATNEERDGEAATRIAELDAALASARATSEERESEAAARMAELEAALANARATSEDRETEAASLRTRITELATELAATQAAFDQKLNTIVAHLAEDHEADLGKAVEEREEARAEARSLSMRLGAANKKLDEERQRIEDLNHLLTETRRAAQAEIDSLRAQQPPQPEAQRPRILIAHPDADLRTSARASLERAGYEIVSAADGLEALRTAIAQQPHVVIADALMPKMDGRELCQLLKSQEKTAHIRVILLMRATDEPPKGDLLPDEVLRKPVPLETLKHTLANLLAPHSLSPHSGRGEMEA